MSLKALYGVAGLGPTQLARLLTNVSGGCAVVIDNKVHKTGPLPLCPSVVFSNLRQFLKHHNRITKSHIAFVVDAPEQLEAVSGLLSLGYVKRKDGHYTYGALQEDALLTCLQEARSDETIEWTYTPVDRLKDIVQDDATDSIVNKLRSLLYSVPNKEVRVQVMTMIFRYLVGQVTLVKVMTTAQKHLGAKMCARIQKHLKSSNGQELKIAYARYKANPSKASAICKAHKVSMFTLRYLEAKSKQK